jgi:predicted 2-oxoglutarate/Fe(II)-dependent dioxygenase YbiX
VAYRRSTVCQRARRRYNRTVIESLLIERFLDDAVLATIRHQFEAAPSAPAGVYGRAEAAVDRRVRSTEMVAVSDGVRQLVRRLLEESMPRIGEHFGVVLQSCEESQFLRYGPGDFFVAHQDGNTPLIRDDSRHRRVSAVIFINSASEEPADGFHGGGSLVFHGVYPDWDVRHVVPAAPGALVAFRPETTHEVTPVTHGMRYTIAAFFR